MASISLSIPMNGSSAAATLNAAQRFAPEILGAIYVAHYSHVLSVCRRFFRHREDAEDAASEVFLKLHRVLDKKNETLPFRPWVSQVAGRHCIDKLRQRKREMRSTVGEIDLNTIPDEAMRSPLSQMLRKEEHRQIREQWIRLPEHYRTALQLHYYRRMTYSEIARTLNRRLPAVKTLIFRAKVRLRRNLASLEAPGVNVN